MSQQIQLLTFYLYLAFVLRSKCWSVSTVCSLYVVWMMKFYFFIRSNFRDEESTFAHGLEVGGGAVCYGDGDSFLVLSLCSFLPYFLAFSLSLCLSVVRAPVFQLLYMM